jgi:hypothetical protein
MFQGGRYILGGAREDLSQPGAESLHFHCYTNWTRLEEQNSFRFVVTQPLFPQLLQLSLLFTAVQDEST